MSMKYADFCPKNSEILLKNLLFHAEMPVTKRTLGTEKADALVHLTDKHA